LYRSQLGFRPVRVAIDPAALKSKESVMSTKQGSKRNMTVILGLFAAVTFTGLSAYAHEVPPGSYQQSCSNPQIVNGRLFAAVPTVMETCRTRASIFRSAAAISATTTGTWNAPLLLGSIP
jgi:hypothetical protein